MKNWPIVCAIIFGVIVFVNPKTRILHMIVEQIKIYKNDKTGRYYWLDLCTFIVVPIIIAVIVSLNLSLDTIVSNAGTIITIFSLIATLPLSFLALLIDKILRTQKEKEVARESFVSITIDIIYSMVIIGMIIGSAFIEVPIWVERIIVGIISFLVLKIALNILMILKRVFSIWEI